MQLLTSWWYILGDVEVFQIKKPTHSKRIVRQLKKESLKEKTEPQIKSEGNKSPKVLAVYV